MQWNLFTYSAFGAKTRARINCYACISTPQRFIRTVFFSFEKRWFIDTSYELAFKNIDFEKREKKWVFRPLFNVSHFYRTLTLCVLNISLVWGFFCAAISNLYWFAIVFHPLFLQMLKMKKHEELETPTFTTSIPIDIVE